MVRSLTGVAVFTAAMALFHSLAGAQEWPPRNLPVLAGPLQAHSQDWPPRAVLELAPPIDHTWYETRLLPATAQAATVRSPLTSGTEDSLFKTALMVRPRVDPDVQAGAAPRALGTTPARNATQPAQAGSRDLFRQLDTAQADTAAIEQACWGWGRPIGFGNVGFSSFGVGGFGVRSVGWGGGGWGGGWGGGGWGGGGWGSPWGGGFGFPGGFYAPPVYTTAAFGMPAFGFRSVGFGFGPRFGGGFGFRRFGCW